MHHLYLTPLSLIYIVSGLAGFAISLYALPRYIFTYRTASLVTDDDRVGARVIHIGIVVTESIRLSIHMLTLSVGIESLLISPAPARPVDSAHRFFGEGIIAILLWANIGTTINSAIFWIQYRLLRSARVRRSFRED